MTATQADFLDDNGVWKCTACGACCIEAAMLMPEEPAIIDRGDGGCKHLKSNMRCRIYNDRPPVCRTMTNSPDATDKQRADACAYLKNRMDRQIANGIRSGVGRKWLTPCGTQRKET